MHYRVLLQLALPTPVVKVIRGTSREFGAYYISLGVNGQNATDALGLAEQHVLTVIERGGSGVVTEVEMEVIEWDDIPEDVLANAFADPEQRGVYWASGRIYGDVEGLAPTAH